MFKKLRQSIAGLIWSNSMSLPQQFLRYGNRKTMTPDWAQVMMSDQDHYTGYSYAAIRNRANAVARIASQHLKTKSTDEKYVHPYLSLITESTEFSENMFWSNISTYLDLEGVYYLMVVRASADGRTGKAKSFKLLNPYNIKRILKQDTLEVGGYIETRKGFQREIPPDLIIPISELNPFSEDFPFAMTDAARESSYTLKSAGDYTRHVLRNNVDAPGIITTDVILPDAQFANFVSRMKDHTKGEPVFGNGTSAIKWTPMNVDLSKSALSDINEVNRDSLFAVTGVSKTLMGIEQSGTTRETSNVQKDLFTENQIVPRIELILDALNLDYKRHYAVDATAKKATLTIGNPVDSDQDTEKKKVEIKTEKTDLYIKLIEQGYDEKTAAAFVDGTISVDKLGKPKNPPKKTEPEPTPKNSAHDSKVLEAYYKQAISKSVMDDQESLIQNAIVNIEGELAAIAITNVPKHVKNAIDDEEDLIPKKDKKRLVNELALILTAFYGVIASIQGKETIADRLKEFGLTGKYILDKISRDTIKKTAEKVAMSHVSTISKDLYDTARMAALDGKGQLQIISDLKTKYSHDITENRARTIARTETNRAFTMAQYDADRQFIDQNGLKSRAYKKYETRSSNPCAFCVALASEGLIPFGEPFRKEGSEVVATIDGEKKSYKVTFDSVHAGNLHPNCSCTYRLIITDAK